MRRILIAFLSSTTVMVGLVLAGTTAAIADPKCQQTDPATGLCLIRVDVPAGPGSDSETVGPSDTGSGSGCFWDGSEQGISDPEPGPVPCSSEYGYWSNNYRCYVRASEPPPPAGDPSWRGHEPGDGAVYDCYQPQTDLQIFFWSQDPPPNAGAGPTPREVAQLAVDEMQLRAIDIGITPQPGPDRLGVVGMPTWMWAASPSENTIGPITASASAGGITINATARLQQLTWDMGDGTKVTCRGSGTPYAAFYGKKMSPDCGHVYSKSSSGNPSGKFAVTATSNWTIAWEGAGQTGTIQLNGLQRSVEITVGEAQVLVR